MGSYGPEVGSYRLGGGFRGRKLASFVPEVGSGGRKLALEDRKRGLGGPEVGFWGHTPPRASPPQCNV